MKNQDSDLDKNELVKALKSIEVYETLKIHVFTKHLKECLDGLGSDGLGLWSEQAGEFVHRVFLNFWNRYKINSLKDPTYGTKLKKLSLSFLQGIYEINIKIRFN